MLIWAISDLADYIRTRLLNILYVIMKMFEICLRIYLVNFARKFWLTWELLPLEVKADQKSVENLTFEVNYFAQFWYFLITLITRNVHWTVFDIAIKLYYIFKTYIPNNRQITTKNGNSQISKGNNSLPSQDATVHIFVQLEEQKMLTR